MTFSIDNLTLGYAGLESIVIDSLSAQLSLDNITAIIGPNGSGKSTFLRGLLNLHQATKGHILLDQLAISKWPKKKLAKRIAFLPQNPTAPEGLTVQQIVEHGRFAHQSLWGNNSSDDNNAIDEALYHTNLTRFAHRPFATLSGGERQRGWIALALAQKADAIFLDEPTTFLDLGHQLEILELIKKLNVEKLIGVVMILHEVNHAAAFADRIIALQNGKIIADGEPEKVITKSNMDRLFNINSVIHDMEIQGVNYPHCIPLASQRR